MKKILTLLILLSFLSCQDSFLEIKNVLVNYDNNTISIVAEHIKRNYKKLKLITDFITITSLSFEGDYNWSVDISKISKHDQFFRYKGVSYTFGYDSSGGMILLYPNIQKEEFKILGIKYTPNSFKMYVDATYLNKNGEIEDQRTVYVSKKRFYFDSYQSRKVGVWSFTALQ